MSNADSNHKEKLFDQVVPLLDQAIRSACHRYSHHSEREEITRLKSRLIWHLMANDYQRLDSYREEAGLNIWLQTVVNNYIYDFLKAERRNVSIDEFIEDAFLVQPDQETSLLDKEEHVLFEKVRSKLPEREQTLAALICEGLSTKEIAERMGIGVPTVYTYRHSLIIKLKLLIQAELGKKE